MAGNKRKCLGWSEKKASLPGFKRYAANRKAPILEPFAVPP